MSLWENEAAMRAYESSDTLESQSLSGLVLDAKHVRAAHDNY
jgi:hypothetical protein